MNQPPSLSSPVINRDTVEEQIYRALRQAILGGQYSAGERLVQKAIADKMGTSRIPVRDALKRLEADGLISTGQNGSYYVKPFGEEELEEIYSLRMLLEPAALGIALPKMTDDDLEEIRRLLDEMNEAATANDHERYVRLNQTFHMTLYEISERPRLIQIIKTLWSGRPLFNPLEIGGGFSHTIQEHELIFKALKRRDAEEAEQRLREHISNALKSLRHRFRKKGAR